MKIENEKKGLFARLIQNKNAKKKSCCGNYVIEEIPEDKKKLTEKPSKGSCCGGYEIEEIPEDNKGNKNEIVSPKDTGTSCCG